MLLVIYRGCLITSCVGITSEQIVGRSNDGDDGADRFGFLMMEILLVVKKINIAKDKMIH